MTTETKHTPGPWLYRESFFGASGIGTPAVSHGDTSAFMCWLNMSGAYGGNSGIYRARADARLIAAAPDLLAALQGLLHDLDRGTKRLDFIVGKKQARAAIERATKG